jgi:hypothetical protein
MPVPEIVFGPERRPLRLAAMSKIEGFAADPTTTVAVDRRLLYSAIPWKVLPNYAR